MPGFVDPKNIERHLAPDGWVEVVPVSERDGSYDGEICQDCNQPLGYVWNAPDWLWNRIMGGPGGILCATCFVAKCGDRIYSLEAAIRAHREDVETYGHFAGANAPEGEDRGPDERDLRLYSVLSPPTPSADPS